MRATMIYEESNWRSERERVWCEEKSDRRREKSLLGKVGWCGRRDWSCVLVECIRWEEQQKKPQQIQVEALLKFCVFVRREKEWIYDDSDQIVGLVGSLCFLNPCLVGEGRPGNLLITCKEKIHSIHPFM